MNYLSVIVFDIKRREELSVKLDMMNRLNSMNTLKYRKVQFLTKLKMSSNSFYNFACYCNQTFYFTEYNIIAVKKHFAEKNNFNIIQNIGMAI